jgi:hypothetical protein
MKARQCDYFYENMRRCQFPAVKTIVITDMLTAMTIGGSVIHVCQKHSDEYDEEIKKDVERERSL